MPYRPRWRRPEKYSAVSRNVLEGTVPVFIPAPPGLGARSTTTTLFPKYAACAAPFSPPGPQPITTRSYLFALIGSPEFITAEAQRRRENQIFSLRLCACAVILIIPTTFWIGGNS